MTRADFSNYVLTCGAGQHSANDSEFLDLLVMEEDTSLSNESICR